MCVCIGKRLKVFINESHANELQSRLTRDSRMNYEDIEVEKKKKSRNWKRSGGL